ncbi:RNA polymerase sigma factor [Sphingobacterium spiritivorum]|uniref:RNA polymerase sigma factor n=1 Tax=Sphingobacterium spiritivorum TaxID=258 RepID=UPI003DA2C147
MFTYTCLSDQELVTLLKQGNRTAFAQIYDRYKQLLYVHALKKLRSEAEAEDIIHDLFATLWNNRETFELKSNLMGYLYTAVRNRIFKLLAHKDIESAYIASFHEVAEQAGNMADHRVRENQMMEMIEAEIAALPAKMREIFELSRKQHLSHKEIAGQLHISEQTVSKQVSNALKILRNKLGLIAYLMLLMRY